MLCVIQIEKDCFSYSAGVDVMNKTEMQVSVRGVGQMINLFSTQVLLTLTWCSFVIHEAKCTSLHLIYINV